MKFTKVMFLHLSVSHSVHRGSPTRGCLVPGVGGCLVQGAIGCLVRGSVGTPPVTATAVGGTHATGMHSCL